MKRTTLLTTLFLALACFQINAQPINGLIAHFPMNHLIEDVHGGKSVVILGSPVTSTTDRSGNICALHFDGSGMGFIKDAIDFSPTYLKDRSVSLWFRYDDLENNYFGSMYRKVMDNGWDEFTIGRYEFNNLIFSTTYDYEMLYGESDGFVKDTNWHHVVAIMASGVKSLYFDGNLVKMKIVDIGGEEDGALLLGEGFVGGIDDIFVYDRKLSEEEILDLYNQLPSCASVDTINHKLVIGKIFDDINGNGIQDPGEYAKYGFDFHLDPSGQEFRSGSLGRFSMYVESSQLQTMKATITPIEQYDFSLPQSPIDLTNYQPYIYDLGWIGVHLKQIKTVQVNGVLFNDFDGNNIFDGNDFYLEDFDVEFQPSGISSTTGAMGVLSENLDSGTVQTLTIPVSMQNEWTFSVVQNPIDLNNYVEPIFDLGEIGVFPTPKIFLASFTTTFPSTLARSRNAECKIQLNNEGNTDLNGTLQVNISGQQLFRKFIYPANHQETELNDSTVRYTFDVNDLAPLQNLLTGYTLFSQAPTGSRIRINYTYTDDSGYTITGINEIQIVAPLDPNYIAVDHTRITPQFVNEQNRLNYTVHFQNLGSSEAENVIIKQNLPGTLRANSIQITSASDEVTLISKTQSQDTIIEWHFNDINLSSAGADSLGSLGYISFSVLPFELQMKDTIRLDAEIYFDTEERVATNFALTSLICELQDGTDMVDIKTFDALCFGDLTGGIIVNSNIDTTSLDLLFNNNITIQYTADSIMLMAGNYVLRSIDKLGCYQEKSFRVDQPDKLITSIIEISETEKEVLIGGGTPIYTIYWHNGYTGYDLEKLPPGLNTYTVTDAHGCTLEGTYEKIVLTVNNPLTSQITIFPNPTNDVINVKWDLVQFDLEILDSRGAKILNSSNILNNESIGIRDLSPGIYYVRLISKQGTIRYLKFSKM